MIKESTTTKKTRSAEFLGRVQTGCRELGGRVRLLVPIISSRAICSVREVLARVDSSSKCHCRPKVAPATDSVAANSEREVSPEAFCGRWLDEQGPATDNTPLTA